MGTGSLLNVASRFQFFYASRAIRKDESYNLKSKHGALILVGGGDTNDLSKAVGTAHTLFKHINANSIGNILSLHTDSIGGYTGTPVRDDLQAIRSAREVAGRLNEFALGYDQVPISDQHKKGYPN